MAYTSFRLRKPNVTAGNGGSAVRRSFYTQDSSTPAGSGTAATDSGLRSENFIVAVPASYLESTFTADVYQRDRVELSWQLEQELVSTLSATYEPTKIVIRASNDGEPTTVTDGIEVVEVTAASYFEQYTDIKSSARTHIADGKWVYYSMFVLYEESAGASYYERVAVLSVQIPYDFGSTTELWAHVPTYYRELDTYYVENTPGYSYSNGPLYRFIDLFGWEIDKIRTTVYDTMRINDPQVIHSSAIDALGNQVGAEIVKDTLGTSKLRALLNNIGYLRRTKGTLDSISAYISALSGCGVSVDTTVSPIQFNVHPHRVNLMSDPLFTNASTTSETNTTNNFFRKFTELDNAEGPYGWGIYIKSTGPLPTVSVTGGGVTLTFASGSGSAIVHVYSRKSFVYNDNLIYYFSAETSHPFSARFYGGGSNLPDVELSPVPVVPVNYFDTWNNATPQSSFPKFQSATPGRTVIGSIPNPSADSSGTSVVPMFKFDVTLSATSSTVLSLSEPLVEYRHQHGDFFTGNEAFGGFIPDATGATPGTYDYHWGANGQGTDGEDFSYYTLDYYRSKAVTRNIVSNYVVPVTMVLNTNYEINWDVLE
jgi:hypothetical protein